MVTDHLLYTQLSGSMEERRYAYRELFSIAMDKQLVHVFTKVINQEKMLTRSIFNEIIKDMQHK